MKTFKIDKFNKFVASLDNKKKQTIVKKRIKSKDRYLEKDTTIEFAGLNSPSIIYYEKIPLFPVFGKIEMSNFLYEADDKLLDMIQTVGLEHKFDKKGNLIDTEMDTLENLADLDLLEQIIEEDIEKYIKSEKE